MDIDCNDMLEQVKEKNPSLFILLWINDGKYKNYILETEQWNKEHPYVAETELEQYVHDTVKRNFIDQMLDNFDEPSLIYTQLPIRKALRSQTNKLPYYPAYRAMDERQRYQYLAWLIKLDAAADIGYAYVLLYGLERHLLFGYYEEARDAIFDLTESQVDHRFIKAAFDSLLYSIVVHQDETYYSKLIAYIDDNVVWEYMFLLAKYAFKNGFTSREIMKYCGRCGYTNRRYINKYPELFAEKLDQILVEEYGSNRYPLHLIKDAPVTEHFGPILCNYSLRDYRSPKKMPIFFKSETLRSDIQRICALAHQNVKDYVLKK